MSLRTRLLLSYTLIVVLCLSIAALSMSVLLQGYRNRLIMAHLDDMTRPIAVQITALIRGQATLTEVWASMREQAQQNRVYILLIDSKGNILRQATPDENPKPLVIPPALRRSITRRTEGTFKTAAGDKFVYVAYPLGKATDSQVSRAETLVLTAPQTANLAIWLSLMRPFIWTGIIALCLSVLMAFFLARSVYRPVQRLAAATEKVAQGQYRQEIPVTGPKEIKALAANFNEMSKNIDDSHQQLRHFVADVSHQLKSPLTSIQGFAQAMLDGTASDSETRTKAARIIVDESNRMIRQVNELLELSRMQAGQVKMVRETVNINELLLHCQEIFAQRAVEKGIVIKNDIEPLTPVMGDVDRLEDVFCNLLDNAVKNTPPQGEVKITARNTPSGAVEISVTDNGPGIPPEQLPYVFKRFQQTSGLRSGFGLGLAIAQEIVLAHQGKIAVFSNPGEGAKFVVTLPASASDSPEI